MRLNLQHFSIHSTDELDSWIERHIFELARLRQIDEANIRLARHADASPAFHVKVHLVTPGPDVVAEGKDHTLRAAFAKVIGKLRDQITTRAARRLKRASNRVRVTPVAA
jgi:ribosome-associated translation inhibitor RaiA